MESLSDISEFRRRQDRLTEAGPRRNAGIVARFLLRYVLLGLAAYAILTSFPASLRGLFAGLFLPVGAIVCEAFYELYAALRRDRAGRD